MTTIVVNHFVVALFKLKPQNVAFWAVIPSLVIRYSYNQSTHDRIDNLWRIHEYREKMGLGGTYNSAGYTSIEDGHYQDAFFEFNQGATIRMEQLTHGRKIMPQINAPFTRFNENILHYPS